MTNSQIAYHQLLETKRHNVASEQLTGTQIEVQARTAREVANINAAASRYSADRHYAGTVYASDQSAAASRYAADTSAGAAMFRSVTESEDRRARLQFDRETQQFLNTLERKRVALSELSTLAQTEQSRAQTRYLMQNIEESIQRMQISAEDLGLRQEAQKFENALRVARTAEAGSKALSTTIGIVDKIASAIGSFAGDSLPIS